MSDTITAQQAVEQILAHRIQNEDGFAARLEADPKGVVAPIVAEVLEDDGDLDFSDTAIEIHTQSPDTLHFVVPSADAEVEGFKHGFGLQRLVMKPIFGGPILMATQTSGCTSTNEEQDAKCTPTPPSVMGSFDLRR